MRLEFPEKLPSWNKFNSRKHWTIRERMNYKWGMLVLEALSGKNLTMFKERVDLFAVVYSTHPLDSSNICVKPIEDALKGRLIEDDSPEYVRAVILHGAKAKTEKEERTILEIVPCSLSSVILPG